MSREIRPFFIALLCTWMALLGAAWFYLGQHPQSHWIMSAALPAFLVEAVFYLAAGFEATRDWLRLAGSARTKAVLFWSTALLPYLMFSLAAETFERNAFYLLAGLTALLAFWHVVLPRRLVYDLGFLVLAAAPIVSKVFVRIYRTPGAPRVDILGHLMWIRLGVAALLILREWDPGPVSFWPRAKEWKLGLLYYGIVLVPIVTLALAIHDVRYVAVAAENWWKPLAIGVATFFAFLWVVGYGEELFFRGFIERALLKSGAGPILAVGGSALIFGSSHLWFHRFPDWRQASVASVLGVACGAAYLVSGSVRVPMVTHALTIATWKVFFR